MLARLRPALFAAIWLISLPDPLQASGLTYQLTDLGASSPVGLNDSGQVALNLALNGSTRAFLYNSYGSNGGRMSDVGRGLPGETGGSSNAFATALTASGQVVVATPLGSFLTDGQGYRATSPTPIADPRLVDGLIVRGDAWNSQGLVVGTDAMGRAALFDGSRLITLADALGRPDLTIRLDHAIAINATGQILVEGSALDGTRSVEHSYLLTPDGLPPPANPTIAPEPGTLAILGLAIAAAGLRQRTGRRADVARS